MNTLENKNILITGATRGIGNKLATHFASQGANIVLLASNEESLNKTYDGLVSINPKGKHLIICCDLSNLDTSHYDEIKLNIDENYDELHGLMLNAAILGKMSALSDYDLETWNKVMNVNLTSQFMLAKTMLPILTNSQKARIIFTSSGVADYGKAFWGAYSVSKFAVKGLAEIFRDELENIHDLKIFNFDPGASPTDMRSTAYPGEDPNDLKSLDDLMSCYDWFFSKDSDAATEHYFRYSELIKTIP